MTAHEWRSQPCSCDIECTSLRQSPCYYFGEHWNGSMSPITSSSPSHSVNFPLRFPPWQLVVFGIQRIISWSSNLNKSLTKAQCGHLKLKTLYDTCQRFRALVWKEREGERGVGFFLLLLKINLKLWHLYKVFFFYRSFFSTETMRPWLFQEGHGFTKTHLFENMKHESCLYAVSTASKYEKSSWKNRTEQ